MNHRAGSVASNLVETEHAFSRDAALKAMLASGAVGACKAFGL